MQNAAGDGAQAPHDQNAAYRTVVSDLVSLVERVQKSLRLIEQAIARETGNAARQPESSTNVIVLDDVSPRYMKAAAALQACDVNLGIALRSLLDPADRSMRREPAGTFGHRGVRPTRRRPAGAYDVLPRKFSPGFSRVVNHLQRSGPASVMPPAHRRTRTPPRRWRTLDPDRNTGRLRDSRPRHGPRCIDSGRYMKDFIGTGRVARTGVHLRIKSEGMLRWKTRQIRLRRTRASGPAVRSASVHRLFGL